MARRRTQRALQPSAKRRGSTRRHAVVEALEQRCLLAGTGDVISELLSTGEAVAVPWRGETAYALAGEWIVQFDEDPASTLPRQLKAVGDYLQANARPLSVLQAQDAPPKFSRQIGRDGSFVLQASRDADPTDLVEALTGAPHIKRVEPNFVITAQQTPDDTSFASLWGLHNTGQDGGLIDADIDAVEAWDRATGSSNIVVASIDTGVDYSHPDLAANLWVNPAECPDRNNCVANGIDEDNNGFVDDFYGIDTAGDDTDPFDGQGHGTHTSGTMAAQGNNQQGVVGVNWSAQVMAVKFLNDSGSGSTADAIAAINYVTKMKRDHGVNVVASNNSWSGGGYSQALVDAIQGGIDEGIMFVASSGNDSRNTDQQPAYPSSYPLDGIISVAATNRHDQLAGFSNYGVTTVDLAAPGVDILSTIPGNGYTTASGTSMAAPHVAGSVALLSSYAPNATLTEIKTAILDSVDPVSGLQGRTVTGGRLNVYQAMLALGMRVVGSSPASNEVVFDFPVQFTVDFSDPYDPSTVDALDLTVNGIAANQVDLTDANRLTFSFNNSPVTAEGLQTMAIAAGSIKRAFDGDDNVAYSSAFRYDATLLDISAAQPATGSTATLPLGTLRVDFNEAFDPSTVDTNDLVPNQGQVATATVIDSDTVEYSLSGLTEEDMFVADFPAAAITDVYGNPSAQTQVTFELDFGSVGFSTLLDPVAPDGSLVYQHTRHGNIGIATDVDRFTIDLPAAQQVSLALAVAPALSGSLQLFSPAGAPIAFTTSASAGAPAALLQNIDLPAAGTYSIEIASADNSTGSYSLRLALNAALENETYTGVSNGNTSTAQSITQFQLLSGTAQHAALLGVLPDEPGVVIFEESFDGGGHSFILDNDLGSAGGLWHLSTGRSADGLAGHTAPNNLYFGQGESALTGGNYDQARAVGGAALTPWITLPDEGLITLAFSHWLQREQDPQWDAATVALEVGDQRIPLLSTEDGSLVSSTAGTWQEMRVDLTEHRGRQVRVRFEFDSHDATQNSSEGWFVDDVVVYGTDDPSRKDHFSLDLNAGEVVTIAASSLTDRDLELQVLDPQGNRLALGSGAENLDSSTTFAPPAAGTYFAQLVGSGEYSLVITRGAHLDSEYNNTAETGQVLTADTALGFLQAGTPSSSNQGGGGSAAGGIQPDAEYANGRLIVRFEEGTSAAEQTAVLSARQATLVKSLPIINAAVVALSPQESDVQAAAGSWNTDAAVMYAEPDFTIHVSETIPNDPLFSDLWALRNVGQTGGNVGSDIDASEVWDLHTNSANVVIASIDTGVDYTHEDLAANMWLNSAECPGGVGQCVADGVDDDNNGYVDDFHGIDTANNDSDPTDGQGHGTHTVGTMAAVGDNAIGVTGINWNVQVMALKFLTDSGSGSMGDAIAAIDYMTMMKRVHGVNIVASNNSWSGGGFSQALQDAIQASIDQGILFVAAAGNDSRNTDATPAYPSSYPLDGLISVAAVDHNDQLASFSNYGIASVDLAAPGVGILSTVPGDNYTTLSGTSMAAPHVAGAAALLAALRPDFSPVDLKAALMNHVTPVTGLSTSTGTGGRLNLLQSLLAVSEPGDYYRVEVSSNSTLTITTETPEAGWPSVTSDLDPLLELYDANGTLLASDDDGMGDGSNAKIEYTVGATGDYVVRVNAASGQGAYVLHVDGAQGSLLSPGLQLASPSAGSSTFTAPHEVVVQFDHDVRLSSLDAGDLQIDGQDALGVRIITPRTIAFTIPVLAAGTHQVDLTAGSIVDGLGRPFSGLADQFTIDLAAHPTSTDELVAYWAFDDGTGTAAIDSSTAGLDHSATLQGDVEWTPFGRGNAINLDGVSDFVAVPNSDNLNTAHQRDRSMSMWFYVRDASIDTRKQVVFEGGGSSRGMNVYVFDNRLYVGGWNTPNGESDWEGTFLSTAQVQSNRWHHVTITLDGSRSLTASAFRAYLDGVEFGEGEGSRLWQHDGAIGIGQVTGFEESATGTTRFHTGDSVQDGDGFRGMIDEVRVYNRVLSASDVAALAGQPVVDPVLLSLTPADAAIWENGGSTTVTLTRGGDTSAALDVDLASSDVNQATVPAQVSFAAGQSQTTFTLSAVDDNLPDGEAAVMVTARAAGYLTDHLVVPVYDDEPAEIDLVAYWDFNDGNGAAAADRSPEGLSHPGFLQQDTAWTTFGLDGSITLDGDGDYVAIDDASDLNTSLVTERSVSAWFYVSDKDVSSRKQVLFEEGGSSRGINIYVDSGSLYVGGWNDVSYQSNWSGTFLSTNGIQSRHWHHVTLVLEGDATLSNGAFRAYLDGVEFGSGAGSQIWGHSGDNAIGGVTGVQESATGTTKFHAGDAVDDGHGWAGLIDEVRIYNRALSDAEVTVLASPSLVDPDFLTLTIDTSSIPENGGSATATLVRTGDTSGSLVVSLVSDDTSEATVPANVTIDPGQTQATFPITAVDDAIGDGSQTVEIQAIATGFLPGAATLVVTDDEPTEVGLIAHWDFNEGSGSTAADQSPHGLNHPGTLQQDTEWNAFGLGGSIALDGDGDYVAVADASDINTSLYTARTVSGWFYVHDKNIQDRKQVIFEEGGSSRGLNIYVHDGSLYLGGWNTPSNESGWSGTFLSSSAIQSGSWHHVALVLDGGPTLSNNAFKGYLDGSLIGEGSGSQVWGHTGDNAIGKVTGVLESATGTTLFHSGPAISDGHEWAGLIDDVRIYDRALDVTEVAILAAAAPVAPQLLQLSSANDAIWENGGTTTLTLTRTGDVSSAVTVNVINSDAAQASVPTAASILAGESQTFFTMTGLDDSTADGLHAVQITAEATGYLADRTTVDVYDDELPVDSLVAYWDFNEGSGTTAADRSTAGLDHPATLQLDAGWTAFGLGGSLALDGDGDFAEVADASDLNTGLVTQRSISGWFYVDDKTISSRKQVVFEGGGSSRGLNAYVHDGSLYLGGWNTPGSESGWAGTFLSTSAIESNRWHHFALVLNGSPTLSANAFTGYLDGVAFGQGSASQIWAHSGDIAIGKVFGVAESATGTTRFHTGAAPTDGHEWGGLIDELRVYNRALHPAEVSVLAGQQLADPRFLTLSFSQNAIAENGGTATATLTRSGDASQAVDINLASSDSSEAIVPTIVSFSAGASQTTFAVNGQDDNYFDESQAVSISATANGYVSGSATLTVLDDEPLVRTGVATATDQWATITLPQSYQSMVVIATPNYDDSTAPLVTRIGNATGNTFDLRLDRADNSSASITNVPVYYLVVEEGVYNVAEHGVKLEAVKFTSTVTDNSSSWNGQLRSYNNSYTNPVVLGQVMSDNDPNFSVFWSRGPQITRAPSNTVLRVGKHVGQDGNKTRANETLGYMVVEGGLGSISGRTFRAGLGSDIVLGVGDSPAYTYTFSGLASASTAVVSQAGMDGFDGSWAMLYGASPVSGSTLKLAVDEDQKVDAERAHTTEQVAYFVFEDAELNVAGAARAASNHAPLTTELLQNASEMASAFWRSQDLTEQQQLVLGQVRTEVTDLPGTQVGRVVSGVVLLDHDAAGYGWFIGWDDEPIHGHSTNEAISREVSDAIHGDDRIDLVTVLAHELGHILGFGHAHDVNDLMSETLLPGDHSWPVPSEDGATQVDDELLELLASRK